MPAHRYIALDAETYYDTEYSLRRLNMQEYIESPLFEEIMWGAVDVKTYKQGWGLGTANKLLDGINWGNTVMVAHNARFDAAILDCHHDIQPKHVLCTMAMAQSLGIHKITGSVSLATLAQFFGVGAKGHTVKDMRGRRLASLTPEEIRTYRGYNLLDSRLTAKIFRIMKKYLSNDELLWQSNVNKMYSQPELTLNIDTLQEEYVSLLKRKAEAEQALMDEFGLGSLDEVQKKLGSANKFAEMLMAEGVTPPTKISPTTGKETFAFAKTDPGLIALTKHDSLRVQQLVNTRIGVKSNTEQTRLEALLRIAKLPSKRFRIPLKVSGAHTHRLSGTDGINVQNFPSGRVEGQSKALRHSIEAVVGKVAAPDSGQIEARTLSVIANDEEMLGIFSRGECPYSAFANKVYPMSVTEILEGSRAYGAGDKGAKKFYLARQAGKGSILSLGFGTGYRGLFNALQNIYRVEGITLEECERIHKIYVDERKAVVAVWSKCKDALDALVNGYRGYFGGADGKLFYVDGKHQIFGHKAPGIRLPDGMWLTYPGIHRRPGKNVDGILTGYTEYAYYKNVKQALNARSRDLTPAERSYKYATRVWHGTIIENLCQATAFAALKYQGNLIANRMPLCLNAHDEFIITGGEKEAVVAKAMMEKVPGWLPGVRFDCEYKLGDNYGDV